MDKTSGKKNDQKKLRLDLIPDTTITALGRVLTFGAEKYSDRNWEQGLNWSRVIGALKRHLLAIDQREDIDPESGLLHSEHLLANAAFLNHYYHTFPEGDDRPKRYRKYHSIGYDLDGVLADFIGGTDKFFPGVVDKNHWIQSSTFEENMGSLPQDFWLSLDALVDPKDLPAEPKCYITKRETCTLETAEQWIEMKGFPRAPIYFATKERPKSVIAKEVGIDTFVDDKYSNYEDLNNNGILCFLMDATYNQNMNVGYKRIYSLNELKTRFRLF